LQSFNDRWAGYEFKKQATAFLSKFSTTDGKPIEYPALLCRKGKLLDGQQPSSEEVRALELSLAFAFIDCNPRFLPENSNDAWGRVTADNTELLLWPIDLEQGRVTKISGYIIQVRTGGYRISDNKLDLRPPLDLYLPLRAPSPDPLVLAGIYETTLESLCSPGNNSDADRIRTPLEWFVKAWRNTSTVQFPERLVFVKTAFEALTGESNTFKCGRKLRSIFEDLSDATAQDSEILVWSPEEESVSRTWIDNWGKRKKEIMTDLETWFMEFGTARNSIIHDGAFPDLIYPGANPMCQPITCTLAYNGHIFFTAEFLLRGVIKVLLSKKPGYEDAWRCESWRAIRDIIADSNS